MNLQAFVLASAAALSSGVQAGSYEMVPSDQFEPFRAKVLDAADPNAVKLYFGYGINFIRNDRAPEIVIYTRNSLPESCGDFRKANIPYTELSRTTRVFNVSGNLEVMTAFRTQGCAVFTNKQPDL